MFSYWIVLVFYLLLADLSRRCVLALIGAFTGPLSKVPGPLMNKLTPIPWLIDTISGNSMHVGPVLFKKYGDVVRVSPNLVLVASKSEIRKIIVEEDLKKAHMYEAIRPNPLITTLFSERDKTAYKHRRRLLSPGFSISYINGLEPLMQECMQVFEEVLGEICGKNNGFATVDMSRMLSNLTSDVMSATSFGGSFGLVKSDDSRLKNLFANQMKRVLIDGQLPFLKYLPFIPTPGDEIKKIGDEVIERRRAWKGPPKKDLVQILLDANNDDPASYTKVHIREEMQLFIVAGSDTTSTTATFTVFLLLNNPEVLKRLITEIDVAFPSKTGPITFSKTQDLPYLNSIINESMRLMPIAANGIPRVTTETTVIGNYEIPPDTAITAFISSMMVDPQIWPDAESFIPERWLGPHKGVEADRKAFMPFSSGSRNCIGQQFALKELRLILVTLFRRFELSLVPGQSGELRFATTASFKQGFYKVGVKPRV